MSRKCQLKWLFGEMSVTQGILYPSDFYLSGTIRYKISKNFRLRQVSSTLPDIGRNIKISALVILSCGIVCQ